jgi:D-arabinose 1-dehydrogenase-like Zn-dependent alcohol dehydrogenase
MAVRKASDQMKKVKGLDEVDNCIGVNLSGDKVIVAIKRDGYTLWVGMAPNQARRIAQVILEQADIAEKACLGVVQ